MKPIPLQKSLKYEELLRKFLDVSRGCRVFKLTLSTGHLLDAAFLSPGNFRRVLKMLKDDGKTGAFWFPYWYHTATDSYDRKFVGLLCFNTAKLFTRRGKLLSEQGRPF